MALVACVSVKICVSTTQFESSHQFTLVCAVSDFITVPGCHYNSCSKSQFCSDWITLFRAVFLLFRHSLSLLYTDLCLLQLWSDMFSSGVRHLLLPLSSSVSASYLPAIIQNSALRMLNKSTSLIPK